MHPFVQAIAVLFQANKNSKDAIAMKQYMRNQFEFLGIKSPVRKQLEKDVLYALGKPDIPDLDAIVLELWQLPEREFVYAAMTILDKLSKKLELYHLDLIEYTLTHKAWWDSVDMLASHIVGAYFQKFPQQILPVTERWMQSGDMWLQRSAIIFQLLYKEKTDEKLLFDYIERVKHSKEFFLQKASGWALRQYARTHPQAVEAFLKSTELSPLAKREARKHLD